MKLIYTYLLTIISVSNLFAQTDSTATDTSYWDKGATFGLQFTQSSFYQWTAGGENAITIAGLHKSYAKYKKGKVSWENILDINYGLIQRADEDFRKNDDRFEFNSAYGYKASKNWYYSTSLNFRSQFAAGYLFKEDARTKISNLLAPGYLTLSLGMDYKPTKNLSVAISPLAGKVTLVIDEDLNSIGSFGVDSGSVVRYEFGGLLRAAWKTNVVKNVELDTKIQLFSNYIEDPQNIDVNWDALVTFKVNKFLNFNILAVLIYDHDILVPKDTNGDGEIDREGRGIQFKEVLALGITYKI